MSEKFGGRFGRAMHLTKLGAGFMAKQSKALLSRDSSGAHRELAEMMVAELGKMKGLPMKIGQLLSYMEGVVPDEHRDMYREV